MLEDVSAGRFRGIAKTFALIAVVTFVAGFVSVFFADLQPQVAQGPPPPPGPTPTPAPTESWSVPTVIAIVTCVVSTASSISAMALAWRADRRSEREFQSRMNKS
jgi:hypothetical protein